MDESSVRRGLRNAVKAGLITPPHLVPPDIIAEILPQMDVPIRLDVAVDGPGAVTADWHHPLTDYPLVNTFIDHAREVGATNWLVIAGDWFNLDALSDYDPKQVGAEMLPELRGSTATMERLFETFDRVIFSRGNHDDRMVRKLGYRLPFKKAMRMLFEDLDTPTVDRIEFTNRDHVWIDSPNGPIYVGHPKAYNRAPLTNARALAAKEHAHILLGHSHHTAIGHDTSGKFVVGELGGFFDAERTAYLHATTTYPKWQQGYGFVNSEGLVTIEGQGWSSRIGRRVA